MQNLIHNIKDLFSEQNRFRNFKNFITEINFPHYKGFVEKERILFNFPITVVVGQNGCGKSSILQALETTPAGKSYSPKWFSTFVDPIKDSEAGVKPCYWYKFYNSDINKIVEVINTRIQSKDNKDYWEPSRPIKMHGMQSMPVYKKGELGRTKTRWEGIRKHIEYIDFRSELSAFDKYFYFEDPPRKKRYHSRQDYIRYFSKYLKLVFDEKLPSYFLRGLNKVNKLASVSSSELTEISNILGKNYKSATIVDHKFYKNSGVSVLFETEGLEYSEAFAGSGEMSIVKLVNRIYNAPENSLILLDEPEVSLHPGAQSKLIEFIANSVIKKRHQVVISTHSPTIVQCLPKESIVVLSQNPEGKFNAICDVPPELAFQYIGHKSSQKKRLIVEDLTAKQLLEKVIRQQWSVNIDSIEIIFHAGGSTDIYKEAVVMSRMNDGKTFLYLDGDEYKSDVPNNHDISDSQVDLKIKEITGIDISNFQFCADSGNNEQLLQEKRTYIEFLKNNCFYLPGGKPEEVLWKCSLVEFDKDNFQDEDYKKRIANWVESDIQNCSSSDISTYRKRLLNEIDMNHEFIMKIVRDLTIIMDK